MLGIIQDDKVSAKICVCQIHHKMTKNEQFLGGQHPFLAVLPQKCNPQNIKGLQDPQK